jgi:hypothetical protein
MIGIASPAIVSRRPERGCLRKPLRCTDEGCPTRDRCKRPGNSGEPHNFKHNRGDSVFCAYFVSKEAS